MTTESETEPNPPAPPGPTQAQRTELVRRLQAEACRRADPLAANLGLMTADLIGMSHGLLAHVQAALAADGAGAVADPQFAKTAELSLRVLRQIDRFAHLERTVPPAADRPSTRVRPWSEEPRR